MITAENYPTGNYVAKSLKKKTESERSNLRNQITLKNK